MFYLSDSAREFLGWSLAITIIISLVASLLWASIHLKIKWYLLLTDKDKQWLRVKRKLNHIWIPAAEKTAADETLYSFAGKRKKNKKIPAVFARSSFKLYRWWKKGEWYAPTRDGKIHYVRESDLLPSERGSKVETYRSKRYYSKSSSPKQALTQ